MKLEPLEILGDSDFRDALLGILYSVARDNDRIEHEGAGPDEVTSIEGLDQALGMAFSIGWLWHIFRTEEDNGITWRFSARGFRAAQAYARRNGLPELREDEN